MSQYNKDFLEHALVLMFDPVATVQMAREQDMPRGASDPRRAQDPHVMMIDVRRAWEQCHWLSLEIRQAIFAYAVTDSQEEAAHLLGVHRTTISRRFEQGLELLQLFLNTTVAEREQWEQDLDDIEKYGTLRSTRSYELYVQEQEAA